MKKTLALVLALAMVFSTITVAFAEDTLGADAQTCANLGMLKGETGSVDAAYAATAPTKLQAAIMVLRLKGLEAEALAFTGTENFADADQVNWAGGKAIMAYLKANPQLGWVGDGVNFNPNEKLTAQMYYKVMLEVLGYKQSTPEVVGDFAWADVFTFAASVGLSKVATVANYTVNDLAIATVEALKLNVKGGDKTLAATLVEAGKMDKAAAVAAGLYGGAVAADAKLDLVKAIGNTTVLVEFTAAIDKAAAENVANYKIDGLEVKGAVLEGVQVVLTTAEMTANKTYELVVGAETKKFGGVSKDTVAPAIDDVDGNDTQRVTVDFTKVMDAATVLNPANYTINNDVTVEAVAWDDDTVRDAVVLTTKGLVTSKTYKVTVSSVKSIDLVDMKSATELFTATSDKTAPKFDEEEVEDNEDNLNTNTRMIVAFEDDNELTKESAEDLANWKITYGSNDANTLEIKALKLVEDEDDDLLAVEITTAAQKSGTKYTVHASNLVDTSVLANKMKSEDEVDVNGKKADTDEPEIDEMNYLSDTLVEVVFDDDSRLDPNTALDINNYKFDEGLSVEAVALDDADDADCKTVVLTVSGMEDKETYELTVDGVADEYGNKMSDEDISRKFKEADLNATTVVKSVKAVDDETLEVVFNNDVKEASAEDESNYTVSGSIGTPKKATLEDDGFTVTLEVAEMTGNTKYTVTVNGVVDKVGNVVTNSTGSAYVTADALDFDAPEVDEVEAINNRSVRVTYNEMIAAGSYILIDTDGTIADAEIGGVWTVSTDDDDMELEYTYAALDATGEKILYVATVGGEEGVRVLTAPDGTVYVDEDEDGILDAGETTELTDGTVDEDDNEVATMGFVPLMIDGSEDGEEYRIIDVTAVDYAGNKCTDGQDEELDYDVDAEDPDDVEVTTWDQVNSKEFTIEFSEKIVITDATIEKSGSDVPYSLTAEIDRDYDNIVHLVSNVVMDDDEEFKIDLADHFTNYHGVQVTNEDTGYTEIETNIEDEDEPYIEDLKVVNSTKIELYFNEELKSAGDYTLDYEDEDGDAQPSIDVTAWINNNNKKLVELTLDEELDADYEYELILEAYAKDIAGNEIDEDLDSSIFEFSGTDLEAVDNYIIGVQTYSGSYVRVRTNDWMLGMATSGVLNDNVLSIVYEDGAVDPTISSALYTLKASADYGDDPGLQRIRVYADRAIVSVDLDPTAEEDIVAAYIPKFAFEDGVDYTFTKGSMSYKYEGLTENIDEDDFDVVKDENGDVIADTYTVQYDDMEDNDLVAFLVNGTVVGLGVVSADTGATVTPYDGADIPAKVDVIVVRDAFDNEYSYATPVINFNNNFTLPTGN